MKKITEFTEEQNQRISQYREHFFRMATFTEPGDKKRATKAALRLAEIGGIKNCEVKFVKNPREGSLLRDSIGLSLLGVLKAFLASRPLTSKPIRIKLSKSLKDALLDEFGEPLKDALLSGLGESMRASLEWSE